MPLANLFKRNRKDIKKPEKSELPADVKSNECTSVVPAESDSIEHGVETVIQNEVSTDGEQSSIQIKAGCEDSVKTSHEYEHSNLAKNDAIESDQQGVQHEIFIPNDSPELSTSVNYVNNSNEASIENSDGRRKIDKNITVKNIQSINNFSLENLETKNDDLSPEFKLDKSVEIDNISEIYVSKTICSESDYKESVSSYTSKDDERNLRPISNDDTTLKSEEILDDSLNQLQTYDLLNTEVTVISSNFALNQSSDNQEYNIILNSLQTNTVNEEIRQVCDNLTINNSLLLPPVEAPNEYDETKEIDNIKSAEMPEPIRCIFQQNSTPVNSCNSYISSDDICPKDISDDSVSKVEIVDENGHKTDKSDSDDSKNNDTETILKNNSEIIVSVDNLDTSRFKDNALNDKHDSAFEIIKEGNNFLDGKLNTDEQTDKHTSEQEDTRNSEFPSSVAEVEIIENDEAYKNTEHELHKDLDQGDSLNLIDSSNIMGEETNCADNCKQIKVDEINEMTKQKHSETEEQIGECFESPTSINSTLKEEMVNSKKDLIEEDANKPQIETNDNLKGLYDDENLIEAGKKANNEDLIQYIDEAFVDSTFSEVVEDTVDSDHSTLDDAKLDAVPCEGSVVGDSSCSLLTDDELSEAGYFNQKNDSRNWKVGYLQVKLPSKSRKAKLKAWQKRWVVIQSDEFTSDCKSPSLMLSIYHSESGNSRRHSAMFWRSVSSKNAVVYRSSSKTHPYSFTVNDGTDAILHLAADSESLTQEWISAIRTILWPPSSVMQLEKVLNGNEFEMSIIDTDFSYRAGLLGTYGFLSVTSRKLILSHPQSGHVIQEWYLNTVDKFRILPQPKQEDTNKVLLMKTSSDSSTGCGEIKIFCNEAVDFLKSLASTIHKVLQFHSKASNASYKKELAELADWLTPPPSPLVTRVAESEGYYKVPPRQVRSLLDIPNFIFDLPTQTVVVSEALSTDKKAVLTTSTLKSSTTNVSNFSQDSGVSLMTPSEDSHSVDSMSFTIGNKSIRSQDRSTSESSDASSPPNSPKVGKKT